MSHKRYHGSAVMCPDGDWKERAFQLLGQIAGGDLIDPFTRPGATKRHRPDCVFTREVVKDIAEVSIAGHHVPPDCHFIVHHCRCRAYGGDRHPLTAQVEMHNHDIRKALGFFPQAVLAELEWLSLPSSGLPEEERQRVIAALSGNFKIRGFLLRPSDLSVKTYTPQDCELFEVTL